MTASGWAAAADMAAYLSVDTQAMRAPNWYANYHTHHPGIKPEPMDQSGWSLTN